MNTIESFFTPIVFQTAHKTCKQQVIEACDDYFSFFSGKKIRVLDNSTTQVFEDAPSLQQLILTSLKIISLATLIIPTLFFIGKLLFRPHLVLPSTQTPVQKPSCYPYDKEKLHKFGLTEDDVEKSRTLRNQLSLDYQMLYSPNWLNDICVNEHLRLQIKNSNKFCFVNSLSVANQKLQRISNPYPVFQTADGNKLTKLYDTAKTIFFPLNVHSNHWTLLVADLGTKKLHYYDSLSWSAPKVVEEVKEYLLKIANLEEVHLAPDAFSCSIELCPQQKNSSDCGVFALLAAKHIINNEPFDYSQEDAPYMRLKILSDFLKLPYLVQ